MKGELIVINIAVCDDEDSVCNAVTDACKQTVGALTFEACSVIPFTNPLDLIDAVRRFPFDLILADIYMPGVLGTDAVRELREAGNDAHVIFITSSKDHAVEAFSLHADNYLVKPFSRQQLADAVAPVIERIIRERTEFVNVKTVEGAMVHVAFSKVVLAQTSGHNQVICLMDGSRVETRLSSAELFDKLSSDERFFKAGSSYILNLDNVRAINGSTATMADGSAVDVPLRLCKKLKEQFMARTFDAAR